MARIAYGMCNVVTGDDSTSYRRSDNSEPAPQVTIPHLRAQLDDPRGQGAGRGPRACSGGGSKHGRSTVMETRR